MSSSWNVAWNRRRQIYAISNWFMSTIRYLSSWCLSRSAINFNEKLISSLNVIETARAASLSRKRQKFPCESRGEFLEMFLLKILPIILHFRCVYCTCLHDLSAQNLLQNDCGRITDFNDKLRVVNASIWSSWAPFAFQTISESFSPKWD